MSLQVSMQHNAVQQLFGRGQWPVARVDEGPGAEVEPASSSARSRLLSGHNACP